MWTQQQTTWVKNIPHFDFHRIIFLVHYAQTCPSVNYSCQGVDIPFYQGCLIKYQCPKNLVHTVHFIWIVIKVLLSLTFLLVTQTTVFNTVLGETIGRDEGVVWVSTDNEKTWSRLSDFAEDSKSEQYLFLEHQLELFGELCRVNILDLFSLSLKKKIYFITYYCFVVKYNFLKNQTYMTMSPRVDLLLFGCSCDKFLTLSLMTNHIDSDFY